MFVFSIVDTKSSGEEGGLLKIDILIFCTKIFSFLPKYHNS